jgi:hypothetical protein
MHTHGHCEEDGAIEVEVDRRADHVRDPVGWVLAAVASQHREAPADPMDRAGRLVDAWGQRAVHRRCSVWVESRGRAPHQTLPAPGRLNVNSPVSEILGTLLPKEEAFLFSVTDQPMLRALDLYRE